jgi:60 kDa SS-A/Ro ribonucleoprotein
MSLYASILYNNPLTKPVEVKNNCGISIYQISPEQRLRRFLILGTDSNTYYQSAKELTIENCEAIIKIIKDDSQLVLTTLIDVVQTKAAPRQPPVILLAYLLHRYGCHDVRNELIKLTKDMFHTPTDVFTLCNYIEKIDKKWNRSLKQLVSAYYKKPVTDLEYVMNKYQQREGFCHRDVMRLTHMKPEAGQEEIFHYIAKINATTPEEVPDSLPLTKIVKAIHCGRADALQCLDVVPGLTWEMLPTASLNNVEVLKRLLPKMPTRAFLRNLTRFVIAGIDPQALVDRIEHLQWIHPCHILNTWMAFKQGSSAHNDRTWKVDGKINLALEKAFNNALGFTDMPDKRVFITLDVSPSMQSGKCGATNLTPMGASIALAGPFAHMDATTIGAFAGVENNIAVFDKAWCKTYEGFQKIVTHASQGWGRTDCALPMAIAYDHDQFFDAFIIITDNETNTRNVSPMQMLYKYRAKMNPNAKLIVVSMIANDFTIANPEDPCCLDVVGWDTNIPMVINSFLKG